MALISSRILITLSMSLALAACATRQGPEKPVTKPTPQSKTLPTEDQGTATVTPYSLPTTPKVDGGQGALQPEHNGYVRPEPSKAVAVLLARADDQLANGDLGGASSSLERAIRIESKNAVLWNRLAHVRLGQKQYEQAAQMAARSNSFAASEDSALRSDNQSIISSARR